MNKEVISDKQGISLIILFITGSSSIFAQGLEAKKDIWLAFILGILMVLPLVIIYARLHYIFPDKDLFDIIEICFGKIVGKGIMILFIWFAFFIAGDILVNYGQFIEVISFSNTPRIIPIMMIAILCVWGVRNGIELLGRFSELFSILSIVILFTISMFLIPNMHINNILPILNEGIKPVLKGTFSVFTFPLAQMGVFTMAFSSFKIRKSPYKVYVLGLCIGGSYLLINSLNNVLVLGVEGATSTYYPTYVTVERINVGDILQRIEIFVSIIFVFGGFIKVSILLLSVCKGMTKIFGLKDYRLIITPISLLIMNLSYFQYDTIEYYFRFNREIWPYYHLPFQVFLPIIILIAAEVRRKRLGKAIGINIEK